MEKEVVLPIIVRCDPNKDEYHFRGNGFIIGENFISVAHNFPEKDWKGFIQEELTYPVDEFEYFILTREKLIPIPANEFLYKEIRPFSDYAGERVEYLDLVVFNLSGIEAQPLELAIKDLSRSEIGVIEGYYLENEYRPKCLSLDFLKSILKYERRPYRQCSTIEGASVTFEKGNQKTLLNCLTLEGSGELGMSGSPVLDEQGKVVGIFCLNDNKFKRAHSISRSYLEKILSLI